MVFSTYVEVIPRAFLLGASPSCILHVCGGDPAHDLATLFDRGYSPRMWRWSRLVYVQMVKMGVFSTYVEVILGFFSDENSLLCILHVCGGDPNTPAPSNDTPRYSPRMWRWSRAFRILRWAPPVFSTYVEVIPKNGIAAILGNCILHVCGGDPRQRKRCRQGWMYSPRMWRYCYIGIPEEIMNVIIRDHKEKF